jgi:hypothetical protein
MHFSCKLGVKGAPIIVHCTVLGAKCVIVVLFPRLFFFILANIPAKRLRTLVIAASVDLSRHLLLLGLAVQLVADICTSAPFPQRGRYPPITNVCPIHESWESGLILASSRRQFTEL